MRKGLNMSMQAAVVIVIALVLGGIVIASTTSVLGQGNSATGETVDNATSEASYASCVQSCRAENPQGGPDYRSCENGCS